MSLCTPQETYQLVMNVAVIHLVAQLAGLHAAHQLLQGSPYLPLPTPA